MAKSNSINSTLDSLKLTDSVAKIVLDTENGSDTKSLGISAGGDTNSAGRGSNIQLYGADHATNAGDLSIQAGVSGSLDIRTVSSQPIEFYISGNKRWEMEATSNDLIYSSGARIHPAAGVTNAFLTLNGGENGPNEGGRFMAFGNTHAFTGQLRLEAGNVSGADIVFQTNGSERWRIDQSDGHILPQASGSYDIGSSSSLVGTIFTDEINPTQTLKIVGAQMFRQAPRTMFSADTVDGADNEALFICGGGDRLTTRGAFIGLYGQEFAGTPGRLEINAGSNGDVVIDNAFTFSNTGLRIATNPCHITQATIDGSDNRNIKIAGGGDVFSSRGAVIELHGNEDSSTAEPGFLVLEAGNVAGAPIQFRTGNSNRWEIEDSGDLVPQASGTYDIGTVPLPVGTVYANSFISEGSPGIHITRESSRGIIDTTEDNDLRLRRNGIPFIQLEDGHVIFTQPVTMESDLNVSGTNNILNTEELLVEDNIITLNSTASGTPTLDSGFEVNRGSESYARLIWDESEDEFRAGISGSEQRIITSNLLETTGSALRPVTDAGMDLGDSSHNFEDLYVRSVQSSSTSLTVGTQNASTLYFRTNATQRWQISHTTGHFIPLTSGVTNIGSESNLLNRVYSFAVQSQHINSNSYLDFAINDNPQWRIDEEGELRYVGSDAATVIRRNVDGSSVPGSISIYAADVNSVLDTAIVQINSVANGGNLDLYCGAGGDIRFFNNTGTPDWLINSQGNFLYNSQDPEIIANTVSGSDNNSIGINGGGADSSLRGGGIRAYGNDHATEPANIYVTAGNNDGNVLIRTTSSAGNISLITDNTTRWTVNDPGHIVPIGNGQKDVGDSSNRVRDLYAQRVTAAGENLTLETTGTSDILFRTGGATKVTITDSQYTPLQIDTAAQTGLGSPAVTVRTPDTSGNRGGYSITTQSGGGLAGMTAEVVTGGAYPNSEGILDLWYQEGGSSKRSIRASQADGVSLYVDSVKRFEVRPDSAVYHKSHDNFADSEYRRETVGHICTTSGAETAYSLTAISNGAAWVTARLVAFDGVNNDSFWIELKTGVRRHDGGSAAIIGSVVKTSDREDASTWDATFDTSGNDLRLRVTAISGVAFTGTIEYQQSAGE